MNLSKNFILFFFMFLLSFQIVFSADDILNITVFDFNPTLQVLQGECKSAPFHIKNRYNESVHIYYRLDKPSDMEITSYPKDYTMLESGATIAGNLNVCIGEYFENDTYNIKFWLETLTKLNESRVKSDKYELEIKVLYNPNLETTTTTLIETTTIKSTTISTIPTYTTIPVVTIRKTDTGTNTNRFKIGNLIDEKKLVTMGVIIILLILVMIPYFTFIKRKK